MSDYPWVVGLLFCIPFSEAGAPFDGSIADGGGLPATPASRSATFGAPSQSDQLVRAIVGRVTTTSAVLNLAASPDSTATLRVQMATMSVAGEPTATSRTIPTQGITSTTPQEIEFADLVPDTRYEIQILIEVEGDPSTGPAARDTIEVHAGFRTARLPGTGPTRFTVFADAHDNRTGWDVTRARPYWASRVVEDALRNGPPDFFLQLGDWVNLKNRSTARPPLPAHATATAW